MKTLDLHKIWEVMNFLREQEDILNEQGLYPYFLGQDSFYYEQEFSDFLEGYSFNVYNDEICVFNNDSIPYENDRNNDYSYILAKLLSFNNEQLMDWIDKKKQDYLERQKHYKEEEKKNIEEKIKVLTEKLKKL
jgi:hypothetical protein